jgi:uncharacterized protein YndB with AHSA1/START domain
MNSITRSITVSCSVEHAFEIFTARIDAWWPPGHRRFDQSRLILEPHVGGAFVERTDDGREHRLGDVLEYAPPHRLRYTWYPGAGTGPTEVDISFTSVADATRVDVVHREAESGLGEEWPQRAELFTRGWGVVLPAFATYLATPGASS